MIQNKIDLACPHCQQLMLQISTDARPIQEQRHTCSSCNQTTKIAKLMTGEGHTFQEYMRTRNPKARMPIYEYRK
jgi:transposase-like protein